MRILGLDLGNRTLGMAISDYLETIANPIGTARFEEQDLDAALDATMQVVKEREVDLIVLGLPKNMDGSIGFQSEYCLKFKEMLEANNLEVKLVDERLTSKFAHNIMLEADLSRQKRKKNVDKLAAAIILQTYLDMKK